MAFYHVIGGGYLLASILNGFLALLLTAGFLQNPLSGVVELTRGERIEGGFKQATAAGVVIQAGGQTIAFWLDKVQVIWTAAMSATSWRGIPFYLRGGKKDSGHSMAVNSQSR